MSDEAPEMTVIVADLEIPTNLEGDPEIEIEIGTEIVKGAVGVVIRTEIAKGNVSDGKENAIVTETTRLVKKIGKWIGVLGEVAAVVKRITDHSGMGRRRCLVGVTMMGLDQGGHMLRHHEGVVFRCLASFAGGGPVMVVIGAHTVLAERVPLETNAEETDTMDQEGIGQVIGDSRSRTAKIK